MVVVTDGRATSGSSDPIAAAHHAMGHLARTGGRIVVLDTETGPTSLGLASQIAERVGATHLPLDVRDEAQLERVVRSL